MFSDLMEPFSDTSKRIRIETFKSFDKAEVAQIFQRHIQKNKDWNMKASFDSNSFDGNFQRHIQKNKDWNLIIVFS